ncbi:MAG: DUF2791 family P-loop domain-containing protein [Burkholderiales bacterium]|nr:DUF2791 family P-loop domain-containing protein [Burkholderiales bacterium]
MKIGDSFAHAKWGRGTILSVESRGRRVVAKVKFGFASDWIDVEEIPEGDSLRSLAPSAVGPTGGTSRTVGAAVSRNLVASSRAGVQALKLGQVLESHVQQISVGTADHEAAFDEAFKQAEKRHPKLIIIEGAWGVGKTHLLTLLSAHAAKRRFAVSTSILDGWAASLSDPMRLLEGITSSIRFPDQAAPMGLGTMLASVKRTGMVELRSWAGPRMVQLMEQVSQEALDDPEAVAVLEDYLGLSLPASQAKERLRRLGWRDVALPALKARSIDERGARLRELLCDWAAFCLAGKARGLLVILDEVDVDYARAAWWDVARRERHDMTLRALGELRKHDVPLVVAFGSAPAGPGEDESIDAVRDVIAKLGHIDVHERANALDDDHLHELAERVFTLYSDAYPGVVQRISRKQLKATADMLLKEHRRQLSPVPRRFVRSLLHCLDLIDLEQASVEEVIRSARN